MKKLCHAVLALVVSTGAAVSSGAEPVATSGAPAHAYFQAAIHDTDGMVTGAVVLVRVGGTADLALGPKSHGRSLRLKVRVEENTGVAPAGGEAAPQAKVNQAGVDELDPAGTVGTGRLKATVTGLVDNREVVVGTLEWADQEVSAVTMHGGDLTWSIQAQGAPTLPARP